MSSFLKWAKDEIIRVIPAVIFFMISFNLIVLSENLMVEHHVSGYISYFLACISALIVGKFLLIVNTFSFINAFPKKPLIYNILWKFLIYGALVILFRMVEKFVDFSIKYESMTVAYQHFKVMIVSPVFWAIEVWLLMLFTIYIVACEFIRVLGKEKIYFLLFGLKG